MGEHAEIPDIALRGTYASKDPSYYAGARRDFLDALPLGRHRRVLEIGCGAGATGALGLAEGRAVDWCGVELIDAAAREASSRLTEVIAGDVATAKLPWPRASFDALLLSEVLEHLVDPWTVLRRLRPLLAGDALVLAGSPNVAHHTIVLMLLRGEWRLEDGGPMDQTHLRWFTPRSYRRLFEDNGYRVDSVVPVYLSPRVRRLSWLLGGRADHLLARQMVLRAYA